MNLKKKKKFLHQFISRIYIRKKNLREYYVHKRDICTNFILKKRLKRKEMIVEL